MDSYDVVVIGAGPAGYVAAIRAAQLGLKTACIDRWVNKHDEAALGGTCLNVGCIPSKALLDSSERYYQARHELDAHGVRADGVSLDLETMIRRKDEIVQTLTGGVSSLFKKNGVQWLKGQGRLLSEKRVEVRATHDEHSATVVEAEHIIIATGSSPRSIPNVVLDHDRIVDSSGAMEFRKVPETLGVIGAGVIGLEMGSVWNRLGSEVVLLEALDDFLSFTDRDIAKAAYKEFTKQGLDIHLGTRVLSAEAGDNGVEVKYQDGDGDHTLNVDRLVVAVGRKPNTDDLNAEEVNLYVDESGFVHVDDHCRTNLPHVYAVGDAVRGPMLAHKGSEEGVMVAERIAGQKSHVNYEAIPWVIYTWPEIAWVGQTESDLTAKGISFRTGSFPLRANGRALAMREQTGMVKIIADEQTDEILGVHIFGPFASELIAEAVIAMEYHASAEDLARTVHAHPTISEAIHEASLALDQRALHI